MTGVIYAVLGILIIGGLSLIFMIGLYGIMDLWTGTAARYIIHNGKVYKKAEQEEDYKEEKDVIFYFKEGKIEVFVNEN